MREPVPPIGVEPLVRFTGGLLTARQVATFMGVSEKTVRRLMASGRLRCIRIGRLARIDPGDVSRFLAARTE